MKKITNKDTFLSEISEQLSGITQHLTTYSKQADSEHAATNATVLYDVRPNTADRFILNIDHGVIKDDALICYRFNSKTIATLHVQEQQLTLKVYIQSITVKLWCQCEQMSIVSDGNIEICGELLCRGDLKVLADRFSIHRYRDRKNSQQIVPSQIAARNIFINVAGVFEHYGALYAQSDIQIVGLGIDNNGLMNADESMKFCADNYFEGGTLQSKRLVVTANQLQTSDDGYIEVTESAIIMAVDFLHLGRANLDVVKVSVFEKFTQLGWLSVPTYGEITATSQIDLLANAKILFQNQLKLTTRGSLDFSRNAVISYDGFLPEDSQVTRPVQLYIQTIETAKLAGLIRLPAHSIFIADLGRQGILDEAFKLRSGSLSANYVNRHAMQINNYIPNAISQGGDLYAAIRADDLSFNGDVTPYVKLILESENGFSINGALVNCSHITFDGNDMHVHQKFNVARAYLNLAGELIINKNAHVDISQKAIIKANIFNQLARQFRFNRLRLDLQYLLTNQGYMSGAKAKIHTPFRLNYGAMNIERLTCSNFFSLNLGSINSFIYRNPSILDLSLGIPNALRLLTSWIDPRVFSSDFVAGVKQSITNLQKFSASLLTLQGLMLLPSPYRQFAVFCLSINSLLPLLRKVSSMTERKTFNSARDVQWALRILPHISDLLIVSMLLARPDPTSGGVINNFKQFIQHCNNIVNVVTAMTVNICNSIINPFDSLNHPVEEWMKQLLAFPLTIENMLVNSVLAIPDLLISSVQILITMLGGTINQSSIISINLGSGLAINNYNRSIVEFNLTSFLGLNRDIHDSILLFNRGILASAGQTIMQGVYLDQSGYVIAGQHASVLFTHVNLDGDICSNSITYGESDLTNFQKFFNRDGVYAHLKANMLMGVTTQDVLINFDIKGMQGIGLIANSIQLTKDLVRDGGIYLKSTAGDISTTYGTSIKSKAYVVLDSARHMQVWSLIEAPFISLSSLLHSDVYSRIKGSRVVMSANDWNIVGNVQGNDVAVYSASGNCEIINSKVIASHHLTIIAGNELVLKTTHPDFSAELLSGPGTYSWGTGAYLYGNKIHNHGGLIYSEGNNKVIQSNGYEEEPAKFDVTTKHGIDLGIVSFKHTTHETVVLTPDIISREGRNFVMTFWGTLATEGARFISKFGTDLYCPESWNPIATITNKIEDTYDNFCFLRVEKIHCEEQKSNPTTIITMSENGQSHIRTDGEINAKGILIVGGHLTTSASNQLFARTLLEVKEIKDVYGLDITVCGISLSNPQQNPLSQSAGNIKTAVDSNNTVESGVNLASIVLSLHNFCQSLVHAIINPSATPIGVSYKHRYTETTQQILASNEGIYVESWNAETPRNGTLAFENAIPVEVKGQLEFSGNHIKQHGAELLGSYSANEQGVTLDMLPNGTITGVGASCSNSGGTSKTIVDQVIHADSVNLHNKIDNWEMDNANLQTKSLSGSVDTLTISSECSTSDSFQHGASASTSGHVSINMGQQHSSKVLQQSGMKVDDASGFSVGLAKLNGADLSVKGAGVGELMRTDISEDTHGFNFGAAVNLNELSQVTDQNKAPDDLSIPTFNLSLGLTQEHSDLQSTLKGVSLDQPSGQALLNEQESRVFTRNQHVNLNLNLPTALPPNFKQHASANMSADTGAAELIPLPKLEQQYAADFERQFQQFDLAEATITSTDTTQQTDADTDVDTSNERAEPQSNLNSAAQPELLANNSDGQDNGNSSGKLGYWGALRSGVKGGLFDIYNSVAHPIDSWIKPWCDLAIHTPRFLMDLYIVNRALSPGLYLDSFFPNLKFSEATTQASTQRLFAFYQTVSAPSRLSGPEKLQFVTRFMTGAILPIAVASPLAAYANRLYYLRTFGIPHEPKLYPLLAVDWGLPYDVVKAKRHDTTLITISDLLQHYKGVEGVPFFMTNTGEMRIGTVKTFAQVAPPEGIQTFFANATAKHDLKQAFHLLPDSTLSEAFIPIDDGMKFMRDLSTKLDLQDENTYIFINRSSIAIADPQISFKQIAIFMDKMEFNVSAHDEPSDLITVLSSREGILESRYQGHSELHKNGWGSAAGDISVSLDGRCIIFSNVSGHFRPPNDPEIAKIVRHIAVKNGVPPEHFFYKARETTAHGIPPAEGIPQRPDKWPRFQAKYGRFFKTLVDVPSFVELLELLYTDPSIEKSDHQAEVAKLSANAT